VQKRKREIKPSASPSIAPSTPLNQPTASSYSPRRREKESGDWEKICTWASLNRSLGRRVRAGYQSSHQGDHPKAGRSGRVSVKEECTHLMV